MKLTLAPAHKANCGSQLLRDLDWLEPGMCHMRNLTIINGKVCLLLHTSAPVTSVDRDTGYAQFTEVDVTNEAITGEVHFCAPLFRTF